MTTAEARVSASLGPVFVCGADRSGTSLVFALLASHPNLSMVRRTNMWRWFHGRFGDLSDPQNLDEAIDTLSRYRRLAVLDPDWSRIRSELGAGEPTYGRLFELMHRHRAEKLGCPRWGDKSLHSEHFADTMFAEFPDARVIQLVRDPRDRYASIFKRYDSARGDVIGATGRWLASARAAERNRNRYQGRYLVVRFEDLLHDPVPVTNHICDFIGEDFVPEMLTMAGTPEHSRGNSSFGDLPANTISTAPIGRWRTVLEPADVAAIQLVAGRTMTRFGYSLERAALPGSERLRFVARMPHHAGRLATWSVRDRYMRHRATVPAARLRERSA